MPSTCVAAAPARETLGDPFAFMGFDELLSRDPSPFTGAGTKSARIRSTAGGLLMPANAQLRYDRRGTLQAAQGAASIGLWRR